MDPAALGWRPLYGIYPPCGSWISRLKAALKVERTQSDALRFNSTPMNVFLTGTGRGSGSCPSKLTVPEGNWRRQARACYGPI